MPVYDYITQVVEKKSDVVFKSWGLQWRLCDILVVDLNKYFQGTHGSSGRAHT